MKLEINKLYQYIFGEWANIEKDIKSSLPDAYQKKLIEKRTQELKQFFSEQPSNLHDVIRAANNKQLEKILSIDTTSTCSYQFPDDALIDEKLRELEQEFKLLQDEKEVISAENKKMFQAYSKICKVISDKFEKNAADCYQHAYKIVVLFGNDPNFYFSALEKYLEKFNYYNTSEQPLHDALIYPLPKISEQRINLNNWRKLIQKCGPRAMKLFNLAPRIEKHRLDNTTALDFTEVLGISLSFKFKRASEHPELASLFIEYNLNEDLFNKTLEIDKKRKSKDKLPNITVAGADISDKYSGYHLVKLPINDPIAYVLGHVTNCCQSMGGHSETCVIDGMTRENNGFYVLLKAKNNKGKLAPALIQEKINYEDYSIVGQGYAWLSTQGNLVIDSWENTSPVRDDEITKNLLIKWAKQITHAKDSTILRVAIGTGGKTPDSLKKNPVGYHEKMKEGEQYYDSSNQALVYCNQVKSKIILTNLEKAIKSIYSNFKINKDFNSISELCQFLTEWCYSKDFAKKIISILSSLIACDLADNKKIWTELLYQSKEPDVLAAQIKNMTLIIRKIKPKETLIIVGKIFYSILLTNELHDAFNILDEAKLEDADIIDELFKTNTPALFAKAMTTLKAGKVIINKNIRSAIVDNPKPMKVAEELVEIYRLAQKTNFPIQKLEQEIYARITKQKPFTEYIQALIELETGQDYFSMQEIKEYLNKSSSPLAIARACLFVSKLELGTLYRSHICDQVLCHTNPLKFTQAIQLLIDAGIDFYKKRNLLNHRNPESIAKAILKLNTSNLSEEIQQAILKTENPEELVEDYLKVLAFCDDKGLKNSAITNAITKNLQESKKIYNTLILLQQHNLLCEEDICLDAVNQTDEIVAKNIVNSFLILKEAKLECEADIRSAKIPPYLAPEMVTALNLLKNSGLETYPAIRSRILNTEIHDPVSFVNFYIKAFDQLKTANLINSIQHVNLVIHANFPEEMASAIILLKEAKLEEEKAILKCFSNVNFGKFEKFVNCIIEAFEFFKTGNLENNLQEFCNWCNQGSWYFPIFIYIYFKGTHFETDYIFLGRIRENKQQAEEIATSYRLLNEAKVENAAQLLKEAFLKEGKTQDLAESLSLLKSVGLENDKKIYKKLLEMLPTTKQEFSKQIVTNFLLLKDAKLDHIPGVRFYLLNKFPTLDADGVKKIVTAFSIIKESCFENNNEVISFLLEHINQSEILASKLKNIASIFNDALSKVAVFKDYYLDQIIKSDQQVIRIDKVTRILKKANLAIYYDNQSSILETKKPILVAKILVILKQVGFENKHNFRDAILESPQPLSMAQDLVKTITLLHQNNYSLQHIEKEILEKINKQKPLTELMQILVELPAIKSTLNQAELKSIDDEVLHSKNPLELIKAIKLLNEANINYGETKNHLLTHPHPEAVVKAILKLKQLNFSEKTQLAILKDENPEDVIINFNKVLAFYKEMRLENCAIINSLELCPRGANYIYKTLILLQQRNLLFDNRILIKIFNNETLYEHTLAEFIADSYLLFKEAKLENEEAIWWWLSDNVFCPSVIEEIIQAFNLLKEAGLDTNPQIISSVLKSYSSPIAKAKAFIKLKTINLHDNTLHIKLIAHDIQMFDIILLLKEAKLEEDTELCKIFLEKNLNQKHLNAIQVIIILKQQHINDISLYHKILDIKVEHPKVLAQTIISLKKAKLEAEQTVLTTLLNAPHKAEEIEKIIELAQQIDLHNHPIINKTLLLPFHFAKQLFNAVNTLREIKQENDTDLLKIFLDQPESAEDNAKEYVAEFLETEPFIKSQPSILSVSVFKDGKQPQVSKELELNLNAI